MSIPLPPTPHQPQPYTGPSAEQVLALRKQYLNPGLFLYYNAQPQYHAAPRYYGHPGYGYLPPARVRGQPPVYYPYTFPGPGHF